MCLFLLSAICPRARESGRCTIFPIMGKVFLQRIQLQLQFEAYVDFGSDSGDLVYFYAFDRIYGHDNGARISVENKNVSDGDRTSCRTVIPSNRTQSRKTMIFCNRNIIMTYERWWDYYTKMYGERSVPKTHWKWKRVHPHTHIHNIMTYSSKKGCCNNTILKKFI